MLTQPLTRPLTRKIHRAQLTSIRYRDFDPLSLEPYLLFDAESSMLGNLENPTLDLDASDNGSLDVITATRAGIATYTAADGQIVTADPDTVRVDWSLGYPAMLIEPSATNLIDYSNLDTAGAWGSSGFSVTQNAITSPDGLNNGTKLEQTSTTRNFAGGFLDAGISSASVTYSFWIKKGSGATHLNKFTIRNNSQSPYNQTGSINLETGEIIRNDFGTGNLIVEPYPNGWFKVKATRDTGLTIGDSVKIYPPYTNSSGENEVGYYNYTFGHQLEYGSVATSYIPTSGSAVTRNADNLVIDGTAFSDFYNATEGTVYVEAVPRTSSSYPHYFSFNANNNSERLGAYIESASYHTYFCISGGLQQAHNRIGAPQFNQLNRVSFSYRQDDMIGSANGGAEVSDTSCLMPVGNSKLTLGFNATNIYALNGHIKRLIYWPTHSDNL